MEMDVNRHDASNLMTISLRCSNNNNGTPTTCPPASTLPTTTTTTTTTSPSTSTRPPSGCCGILSRLFCVSRHKATQSVAGSEQCSNLQEPLTLMQRKAATATTTTNSIVNRLPATQKRSRRTPQEIYFESRGKSCKKLLKFNGNSNKILLYPEEGWARTASSSYWTITPCWWQPNRCRIVECSGTQRQATRARMVPLEQQGSLLIAGHFRRTTASASASAFAASSSASGCAASASASGATVSQLTDKSQPACNDEFKLYLTSNISMEDYNMGYCLTGFVERRCQLTNTFQMTHFAVIKRQWPQPSNLSNS